jgi:homogentisate 1,2-dioxygenase
MVVSRSSVVAKSIGTHETHELAVMCDTFYPLKLTKFAKDLDDGKYAYSWYETSRSVLRLGLRVER